MEELTEGEERRPSHSDSKEDDAERRPSHSDSKEDDAKRRERKQYDSSLRFTMS